MAGDSEAAGCIDILPHPAQRGEHNHRRGGRLSAEVAEALLAIAFTNRWFWGQGASVLRRARVTIAVPPAVGAMARTARAPESTPVSGSWPVGAACGAGLTG